MADHGAALVTSAPRVSVQPHRCDPGLAGAEIKWCSRYRNMMHEQSTVIALGVSPEQRDCDLYSADRKK